VEAAGHPSEKELFQKIGEQRKIYLSSRDQIVKLKAEGKWKRPCSLLDKTFVPAALYQQLMRDMVDLQRKDIDDTAKEIDDIAAQSRVLILVLEGLILLLGIVLARYLDAGHHQAAADGGGVAQGGEGDLRPRCRSVKDETGSCCNP
jgi:methyl-accepting chemotaxis protein